MLRTILSLAFAASLVGLATIARADDKEVTLKGDITCASAISSWPTSAPPSSRSRKAARTSCTISMKPAIRNTTAKSARNPKKAQSPAK